MEVIHLCISFHGSLTQCWINSRLLSCWKGHLKVSLWDSKSFVSFSAILSSRFQNQTLKNQSLTAKNYFRHGHLDENCPNLTKNKNPWTILQNVVLIMIWKINFNKKKMLIWKKYKVNEVTIHWECHFKQVLDSQKMKTLEKIFILLMSTDATLKLLGFFISYGENIYFYWQVLRWHFFLMTKSCKVTKNKYMD